MRTAIATVICCNYCQRRHTNSRCHTDNCRRADSSSSHATSGSSRRGRCGASSTRRCLGPVCCFRAANAAGVVNMKAIRIAESLCFITFPLFIAWTIRTLEIRIVYFECNMTLLNKSNFAELKDQITHLPDNADRSVAKQSSKSPTGPPTIKPSSTVAP